MKSYRRENNNNAHRKHVIESMLNRWNDYDKNLLNEMALPLKAYVNRIEDLMYQLAENQCLCKWCQMFDPQNVNFNHWKEELFNYMNRLAAPKLKNNIGKKKHLEKYLINWYDLDDKEMVRDVISHKFNKEHITDESQKMIVAEAFTKEITKMINAIATNVKACETYVEKAFASMK